MSDKTSVLRKDPDGTSPFLVLYYFFVFPPTGTTSSLLVPVVLHNQTECIMVRTDLPSLPLTPPTSASPTTMKASAVSASAPVAAFPCSVEQPLLQGLAANRAVSAATARSALQRHEAAAVIRAWLWRHHHRSPASQKRQRQQKQERQHERERSTTTTTASRKRRKTNGSKAVQVQVAVERNAPTAAAAPTAEHWLWGALRSYSVANRRAAATILLQAACRCPDCSSSRSNSSRSNSSSSSNHPDAKSRQDALQLSVPAPVLDFEHLAWRLAGAVLQLLDRHVGRVTSTSSATTATTSLWPPSVATEWTAILKHLMHANRSSFLLALGRHNPATRRHTITSGGLHWLTDSIWKVTTALQHGHASASSSATQVQVTLQAAAAGLTDLLQDFVLLATDAASVHTLRRVQERWLWNVQDTSETISNTTNNNNNNTNWSPLAALIGAHHVCSVAASNTKAAALCAAVLAQLVDPTSRVVLRPSSSSKSAAPLPASEAETRKLSTARSLLTRAMEGWNRDAHGHDDEDDDDDDDDDGGGADDDDDDEDDHVGVAQDEMEAMMQSAQSRIAAAVAATAAAAATASATVLSMDLEDDDDDDEHDDDDDDDDEDEEHDDEDEEEEECKDGGMWQNEAAEESKIPHEEDEEIESMDEDEAAEQVCVDEDEDDHTIIREEEVSGIEARLLGLSGSDSIAMQLEALRASDPDSLPTLLSRSSAPLTPSLTERKRAYIIASLQVLSVQHPHIHHHHAGGHQPVNTPPRRSPLSMPAENALLESINAIVKPPKKPINTKIIMRRAPTQEEFFRGSLSRNPISTSMLKPSGGAASSSRSDAHDPTVADLRQHIADDLQMSDSAELIEILVANKILDVNLKLRVVHQVLWRTHLMENSFATSGVSSYLSGSSAPSLFSSSGLSVVFGGGSGTERTSSRGVTADSPASTLPAMVATYRLAGLDGEATEDTVSDLVDPDAPAESASPEETERALEKEYGLTRLVTNGRGVFVMLRSVQHCIMDTLRRIRRDDVGCTGRNPSRIKFKEDPPCPGLALLRHCSKLPSNRKMLLQARAPTVLLSLLLDVLGILEDPLSKEGDASSSNPTAEVLQELIEVLACDISTATPTESSVGEATKDYESDAADAASMPLLLESIETISLSAPLHNVIAKLLPFLTYGQADLSRQLAQHFARHILVGALAELERDDDNKTRTKSSILMNTFVQTAISLPPNEVCNSLRIQLINCGFIEKIILFIAKDMPKQPPPWSSALWSTGEAVDLPQKKKSKASGKRKTLEDAWRVYFSRGGIRTAFKILTGLCKQHAKTQARIAMWPEFLHSCHWIEATSDSTSAQVFSKGLGLLAETLVDEMKEDNVEVSKIVAEVRQQTHLRKKELAQERRRKALGKMNTSGPLGNATTGTAGSSVRDAAAYVLAPVLDLFRDSSPSNAAATASAEAGSSSSSKPKASKVGGKTSPGMPAWMAEMELIEDETGLTCAVCQEGRTLQPTELLGLYAHIKKVSLPMDQRGSRYSIDGTALLKALPPTLPSSLAGSHAANVWYPVGRAAGEDLPAVISSSSLSVGSSASRRNSLFTTTVSAGNAIHFSCHRKARLADRNHPKAPKSEWEGANLRNNRVSCNAILPLVSNRSSKVPLMAVESALTEHQTAVSNLLGYTPKSMLWTILHDVRLLLLRMAYGESLNTDCGGGSLASNVQLLLYQLQTADMFDKDAQVDQPVQSQHARCLSSGFLAACAVVAAPESQGKSASSLTQLTRGIADAAPMAALTSILFYNATNDESISSSSDNTESSTPHPKRQWVVGKEHFLRGLLICAGRRHALSLEGSGCGTARGPISRQRSSSFAEWDLEEQAASNLDTGAAGAASFSLGRGRAAARRSAKVATITDFSNVIRPMITFYAVVDQLSAEFNLLQEDIDIGHSAERLVHCVEECQRAKSIHDLLDKAKVIMDHDEMMEYLQKGMVVA